MEKEEEASAGEAESEGSTEATMESRGGRSRHRSRKLLRRKETTAEAAAESGGRQTKKDEIESESFRSFANSSHFFHPFLSSSSVLPRQLFLQVKTDFMDGVGTITQVGVPGFSVGKRRKLSASVAGAGNITDPPPPVFIYDFVAEAAGAYW